MFKSTFYLMLLASTSCLADVWRCDGLSYTTSPIAGKSCILLSNYPVCGHGGNRFIAPAREGLKSSQNSCERKTDRTPATDIEKTNSPFVNTAFITAYKGYKAPPTKRWTTPTENSPSKLNPNDFSFGDPKLPDIGVFQEILRILQGAKKSIEQIP